MEKLRIIIGGFIGLLPAGGVAWDYIQYVLGFRLLGHDVYYLEDTRIYPVFRKEGKNWDDCTDTVAYLSDVMHTFDLSDKWCYRDEASGACYGMSVTEFRKVCQGADILINISCSTFMRDEYLHIPIRLLVDSDPMFTQIQYLSSQIFTPGENRNKILIDAHTHHFTFGENIHKVTSRIPHTEILWKTTRQPVCLPYWPKTPLQQDMNAFTTVMNWSAGKKLVFAGETWGQKDVEFPRFIALPTMVPGIRFTMAVRFTENAAGESMETTIRKAGWEILDPDAKTKSMSDYQRFIQASMGEFSVAKETYVKAGTGWFSCRSACYLASGRPVVTQDTGWTSNLPSGEGLIGFNTIDEAASAIATILSDPRKHSQTARVLAEEYFDSSKVLSQMLINI